MALHGGQVQATDASGVAQLWSPWDQGVPALGGIVSRLLGGYGAYIQAGTDAGSYRQQRRIQPRELPLDFTPCASKEPSELTARGHRTGAHKDRHSEIHIELPVETEAVYDIRNAGPRSRFVVRGNAGLFIVHNCVQALARIVVTEQMLEIIDRYKIALQVHDEVVVVCDQDEAEECKAYVEAVMSKPPVWAPDLPVACEADYGTSYGEVK